MHFSMHLNYRRAVVRSVENSELEGRAPRRKARPKNNKTKFTLIHSVKGWKY